MCTRFYIEKENATLADIAQAATRSSLTRQFLVKIAKPMLTSGEIRPTDLVPVIAPNRNGEKAVFPMKWGFTINEKAAPLVNARVETAAQKPTFKESWERRRCIIPASWYFEWMHYRTTDVKTKTGDKYLIQPKGAEITWLCGLYRFEDGLPVFTVLTREPGQELAKIHDRMPLILPNEKVEAWIRPDSEPEKLIPCSLTDMIMEKAPSMESSQMKLPF